MATVFMKWLERSPRMYDRGIRLLTLGRLVSLWDQVVEDFIRPGLKILELGCGTGGLTCRMAKAGAEVTAIDHAPGMLTVAMDAAAEAGISDKIHFKRLDATQIGEPFPESSFDLVVASLMISELTPEERALVLDNCAELIAPDGKLVLLDEVIPSRIFNRLAYYFFRIPLAILTWVLTRTSTHPLRDVKALLERHGYHVDSTTTALGGSLGIFYASPSVPSLDTRISRKHERLQHKVTLRTILVDVWTLFFRIIPPYPKVKESPEQSTRTFPGGTSTSKSRRFLNPWALMVTERPVP